MDFSNNKPDPDPRPDDRPSLWFTWNRLHILGLFFVLIFGDFFFQIVFYEIVDGWFVPALLGAVLGIMLPLYLLHRTMRLDLRRDLALGPVSPVILAVSGLMAIAALVPTSLLAELSLYLHPADPGWAVQLQENLPTTPVSYILVFLAVSVIGPLAEELLFRGLLQQLVARTWGLGAGVLISALVFGIVHGQPWLLFGLIGIGLMLAFIFATTRSVLACWLAHAVHNTLSLVIMLTAADLRTEPVAPTTGDLIWCGISVLALLVLGRLLWRSRVRMP